MAPVENARNGGGRTTTAGNHGDPLISLDGVIKVFTTDEVETHSLSGVHLRIERGEYVGKTVPPWVPPLVGKA